MPDQFEDGSEISPLGSMPKVWVEICRRLGFFSGSTNGGGGITPGILARGLKGEAGAHVSTTTTKIDGDFEALQVIADAVLSALASSSLSGDTLVSVTLPAGTIIYGRFSSYTLASGKIIAYNKN